MGEKVKAQFCSEFLITPQKHLSIENKNNDFAVQDQSLLLFAKVAENENFHLVALVRHTIKIVLCDVDQLLEQSHVRKCGTGSLLPTQPKGCSSFHFFFQLSSWGLIQQR